MARVPRQRPTGNRLDGGFAFSDWRGGFQRRRVPPVIWNARWDPRQLVRGANAKNGNRG